MLKWCGLGLHPPNLGSDELDGSTNGQAKAHAQLKCGKSASEKPRVDSTSDAESLLLIILFSPSFPLPLFHHPSRTSQPSRSALKTAHQRGPFTSVSSLLVNDTFNRLSSS